MKTPDNPFVLSGYFDKKYFCDREGVLDELEDHLSNGRNIVLYAWRRMGKTALIKCLFAEMEKSKGKETLYIDLLTTQTISEAIRTITLAVYHKYGKTSKGFSDAMRKMFSAIGVTLSFDPLSGVPEVSLGMNQAAVPERSLTAIGEFLSGHKKGVVIALDEFQQVSDFKESNGEAIFRSWMQEFPSLRFMYSGSHRGIMEAMFAEKSRPFYKSAQLMSLDAISPEAYIPFIQKHFSSHGKSIGEDMILDIYEWCRGQTYSIQLVCNYLYSRCKKVTKSDLDSVIKDILDQENAVFINYQNILPSNQWQVLRAIAKEGQVDSPTGQEFVIGHRLGAASSVQRALQSLVRKEMVVKEADGYMVHDIILSRWLARLL